MRRRLGVAVTALMVALQFGSAGHGAEPNLEELGVIAGYLDSNDVEGLRQFLRLRPELMEGETPLATLLREFMNESRDLASFLSLAPEALRRASGPDDNEGDRAGAFGDAPDVDPEPDLAAPDIDPPDDPLY